MIGTQPLSCLALSILKSGREELNSDCNWARTQNHLVLKRTLYHLAKLAKWSSCVLKRIRDMIKTYSQELYSVYVMYFVSYSQIILHTFPDIKQHWELLTNNNMLFSRVYTKQYWHFQRVPSKLDYSKKFCQSSFRILIAARYRKKKFVLTK